MWGRQTYYRESLHPEAKVDIHYQYTYRTQRPSGCQSYFSVDEEGREYLLKASLSFPLKKPSIDTPIKQVLGTTLIIEVKGVCVFDSTLSESKPNYGILSI